jgi:hypothetical protein
MYKQNCALPGYPLGCCCLGRFCDTFLDGYVRIFHNFLCSPVWGTNNQKGLLQNKNFIQNMVSMHKPAQPYFVFNLSFATAPFGTSSTHGI